MCCLQLAVKSDICLELTIRAEAALLSRRTRRYPFSRRRTIRKCVDEEGASQDYSPVPPFPPKLVAAHCEVVVSMVSEVGGLDDYRNIRQPHSPFWNTSMVDAFYNICVSWTYLLYNRCIASWFLFVHPESLHPEVLSAKLSAETDVQSCGWRLRR